MASLSVFKPTFRRLSTFLAIPVVFYGFFAIAPIVWAIWYSLHTDFNFQFEFAWFENYRILVRDPAFWLSYKNNLIIIGINFVFQVVLAFGIAIWIHGETVLMKNAVRSLIFFPTVLAPVVVAFLFRLVYNVDYGVLNVLLRGIGLGGWARPWLSDPGVVIYAVTFVMTWQYTGFFVVIFLAGLTNIDSSLMDAADIDGASRWQKTVNVTFPLMAGTWRAVLVLSTANGMKVFEHPMVLTGGGPGIQSSVLAVYSVNSVFMRNKLTYGTAVAVGGVALSLAMIVLATTVLDRIVLRRRRL